MRGRLRRQRSGAQADDDDCDDAQRYQSSLLRTVRVTGPR